MCSAQADSTDAVWGEREGEAVTSPVDPAQGPISGFAIVVPIVGHYHLPGVEWFYLGKGQAVLDDVRCVFRAVELDSHCSLVAVGTVTSNGLDFPRR